MALKLTKEFIDNHCRHHEHEPPGMIVLKPGMYEHTCDSCGKVTRFNVPLAML
jgi:hypothetical protein